MKHWIIILLVTLSTVGHASRLKAQVQFSLTNQSTEAFVPFVVVVPHTFNGQFVRFVHPRNGKSAVAKVIKKEGDHYKTNPSLANAIGIESTVARVFVEEVY